VKRGSRPPWKELHEPGLNRFWRRACKDKKAQGMSLERYLIDQISLLVLGSGA